MFQCNRTCLVVLLAAAAPAQADIILLSSAGIPLPQGGLVSYTLSAISTDGEIIQGIRNPSIVPFSGAGLHQVWPRPTGTPTPTRQEHLFVGTLWNEAWTPYDSYFFFENSNSLSVGGSFTETISSDPNIILPDNGFFPPITGFGTYGTSSEPAAKAYTPASGLAGDSVMLAQLVLRSTDFVSVSLEVLTSGGVADVQIEDFVVGGCCPPPFRLIDQALGDVERGTVVTASLVPENGSADLFEWELFSFNGTGAAVDPATGQFTWDSTGAPLGEYTAVIRASHFEIGTDTGTLTFNLVPEPATLALLAATLLGIVAFNRRR